MTKCEVDRYLDEKGIACPGCGQLPERWTHAGTTTAGQAGHWDVTWRCQRCQATWTETVETTSVGDLARVPVMVKGSDNNGE